MYGVAAVLANNSYKGLNNSEIKTKIISLLSTSQNP